ncbi:ABC transporter permease [Paenibacillus sp. GCM10012303]|jgi:lipopolysaccharide transport system permease protein|uniref:ABC transporter permease n=1 Tax=Paenibacillus sp. GCM10012303 TaxID=3317340 RepID=UPI00360F8D5E
MVVRDFKTKYLNTVFGSLWAILNPLAQILIYTLIFSQVMKAKLPAIEDDLGYSIYLIAGIVSWQFFSEVLNRTQTIFLEQANLIKKVNFPRISLPLFVVISAAINYMILMALFILFLFLSHREPAISFISLVPLLILQQCIACGLGIFFATLNVFFRDIGHSMSVVLQFWFWLTPIVYPIEIIPQQLRWILDLNPLSVIIRSTQDIFLYGFWPVWERLIPVTAFSILCLLLGYFVFRKLNKELVDEL